MTNIADVGIECCGCHACEQVCKTEAVSLRENEEGFFYPSVSEHCNGCGICQKVCPVMNTPELNLPAQSYAAYSKDAVSLRRSSSGGIFMLLAEKIIESDGVVFGCAENTPGFPRHVAVGLRSDLPDLQGSKYTESDMKRIYLQVKEYLDRHRAVLFCGTPCQVAGLRNFVGKSEKLTTVDLICHGVPSRKMYREYLRWLSGKRKAVIRRFVFRSKKKHDWSLTFRAEMIKNGKEIFEERMASQSPYYRHYLCGLNCRESCYLCRFAQNKRAGDITLGDFWGIEKIDRDLYNRDGVSAVLINTAQGQRLWDMISDAVHKKAVDILMICKYNGQLNTPIARPAERDTVYRDVLIRGYDYAAKKYGNFPEQTANFFKDLIPNRIRQRIKQNFYNLLR